VKLVLLVLAVAATFEHVRLARLVARTVTNADVTLMWFTARELGAGHLRGPNVYGQTYGSNIEALPMEALRRLGVPLGSATLLVWALLALGGWFLLALAAWRRGRVGLAVAAVAAPAVLSAYYTFVVSTVATYQGAHFLVVAGAAVLIARPHRGEPAGWALLGLGVALDPSGALVAVPVGAWALLAQPRSRARVVALGAVVPLAYEGWKWWFYRAHPDYDVFGQASVRPSLATLGDNLGRLERFFGLFSPEVAHLWPTALVLAGVLVVLVALSGRITYLLPALGLPLLLLWGMATPKSVWDFGRFLSPARIFATLPYGLWFLGFLVAESGALARLRLPRALPGAAVAGLVVLALVSVGLRQGDYEHRVVRLRDAATTSVYGFSTRVKTLERECGRFRAAAKRVDASVVVFVTNKTLAYGCGARDYGQLDTLLPGVERRTWRLYEERGRTRAAALLQGVGPHYCDYAAPRVTSCRALGADAVALSFPRQSLLSLLAVLNVAVRAFGPNCHPKPFGLGAFLCPNGLEPSIADLTTGAPPPNQDMARREIEGAFVRALDVGAGFTTVEDGASILAKERARGPDHAAALGRARTRVDAIHFLNARQAAVDFRVTATEPHFSRALRGWAIRRDGSWYVDRNTFCALEWSATFEGDLEFRKTMGGCSGEQIAVPGGGAT
jgi:hypothetical protein